MIKQKEYARRRRQLMRMAGEESIIILQAAPARLRNNDVYFPYRQDSDFLYLTGFREHDALLVLLPEEKGGKSILFCRNRDPEREMWDGRMVGLEAAIAEYGMDEAYEIKEAETRLRGMLQDMDRIYYDLGRDPMFDQRLIGWLNEFRGEARKTFHAPEEIHALDHMLHDMRVYKSREELSAMRRSAKVAIEAHEIAMQICKPGLNEADVVAPDRPVQAFRHRVVVSGFHAGMIPAQHLVMIGMGKFMQDHIRMFGPHPWIRKCRSDRNVDMFRQANVLPRGVRGNDA